MPFCTACGHQNPDDARFCSQCGTRIATAAAAPPAAQPAAPASGASPAASGGPDGGSGGAPGGAPGGGPGGSETGEVRRVEATDTMTFRSPPAAAPPEQGDDRPLNEEDAAAVDALPAGSALLVVQRGPDAGSRFLLDTDVVTAGRHPDSEIFLDDVTVSRRHAEFRRTPDGFRVSDVGSLNGTYVNRDRIDELLLHGGDEVQIGKYRLVYFTSQGAQAR